MSTANMQPGDSFEQLKRVLDTLTNKNIDIAAVPIFLVHDLKTATDQLLAILWGILTASTVGQVDIATATARAANESLKAANICA